MPDRNGPLSLRFRAAADFISDYTEETAIFLQASVTPLKGLNLVAGGRYDHFNQFGGIWTYRFAGSYLIPETDTHFARQRRDRIQSAEQPGQDFWEQSRTWSRIEESGLGCRDRAAILGRARARWARPIFTTTCPM